MGPIAGKPADRDARGLTTGRVESFSDGVLAIAITLLVLQLGDGDGQQTGAAVCRDLPGRFDRFLLPLAVGMMMRLGGVARRKP